MTLSTPPWSTRLVELRAALASTNEARPHECPSTGVGAGGGRDRSLDRRTPVVTTLPPVHAVSHCHNLGNSAHVRDLAMRLIRSRCRRSAGSRLRKPWRDYGPLAERISLSPHKVAMWLLSCSRA